MTLTIKKVDYSDSNTTTNAVGDPNTITNAVGDPSTTTNGGTSPTFGMIVGANNDYVLTIGIKNKVVKPNYFLHSPISDLSGEDIPKCNEEYVKEAADGKFVVPVEKNYPVCDSMTRDVFFQMTISKTHPFYFQHGKDMAKSMNQKTNSKKQYLIYVVPEDIFDKFKYQMPTQKGSKTRVGKSTAERTDEAIQQAVVGISNQLFLEIWDQL